MNEIGQAHVADELKRHGIDWDLGAVCTEIEDGLLCAMDTIRASSNDTYDEAIFKLSPNEADNASEAVILKADNRGLRC